MLFLMYYVGHIEDLGDMLRENKWLFLVPNILEVNRSEPILVFLNAL
uniref:Uncharacterized protein n=1 Tax=Arundo donax TaxID=35708 RepID=A0A0A8ZJU0_ARUDO